MNTYVIDACVILKWVFRTDDTEEDVEKALTLLQLIENNKCRVIQPVHWLTEVIAVATRQIDDQHTTDSIITSLKAMNFRVFDEINAYSTATRLSSEYKHPLYDTLYHAVALESVNTHFITADKKYFNKAKAKGAILLLSDFETDSETLLSQRQIV